MAEARRWWGVEHQCDGQERTYPTLHWADEPEHGVGPRRAFECDACGERYLFTEEPRTPNERAVRRILAHLWGEDFRNIKAAIESFPNGYTVVPKAKRAPLAEWSWLIDNHDAGTVFITDDPHFSQTPIVEGLSEGQARAIVYEHNVVLARLQSIPAHRWGWE